jgi:hypothetical protein
MSTMLNMIKLHRENIYEQNNLDYLQALISLYMIEFQSYGAHTSQWHVEQDDKSPI